MGFYTYHIVSSYTHLVTMNHNDIMVRSTTIQIHQVYRLSHQSSQINTSTMRNSGNVTYMYIYIYLSLSLHVCICQMDTGWNDVQNPTRPVFAKNTCFFGRVVPLIDPPEMENLTRLLSKSKERLFHPEPQMRYWDMVGERVVGRIAKLVEPTRLTRLYGGIYLQFDGMG